MSSLANVWLGISLCGCYLASLQTNHVKNYNALASTAATALALHFNVNSIILQNAIQHPIASQFSWHDIRFPKRLVINDESIVDVPHAGKS